MDTENEKELKQILINENIIDRGYNLDEFQNFISRTRGVELDEIPYNALKISVSRFITEKLNSIISTSEIKEKKEDPKASLFEFLYSKSEYEITTQKQTESQLITLEKIKMKISIDVSQPQIEKSNSFFKGQSYNVLIESKELGSTTRKNINDIIWLQNKYSEMYPFDLTPPLKTFGNYNKKEDLESNVRYVQKFFNFICRRKILRTSPLLYNFLTLPDDLFKKFKGDFSKTNMTIKPDYSNFITVKGQMKFDITPEKAISANSISTYISPTITMLNDLVITLQNISTDYDNLSKHMKLAADIFLALGRDTQKYKHKANATIAYAHWNTELTKCAENYNQIGKIFNEEIKETFDFLKMEISQINPIFHKFETKRDAYEIYGGRLKAKKEALFAAKKFSKWETNPKAYIDFQILQNDKKKAFDAMCYKENVELEELKKHVCVLIYKLSDQFDKAFKYQEEQIEKFGKNFSEIHKKLAEEDMNIIKLFVPQFI